MNTDMILEKLNELRCSGMHDAVKDLLIQPEARNLSFEEKLSIIIDRECVHRDNIRRQRLLYKAKLKCSNACVENIDYCEDRSLEKSSFISLTTCDWIRLQQNIVFTGPTGVGKTYLACALGQQACRHGFTVKYVRVSRLFEEFKIAQAEGRYNALMMNFAKPSLLILDDWGLGTLNKSERIDLLELLEDRTSTKSTIITTQLPIENWHEYIGNATVADAILDRVLSCAHKINIKGKSMRKIMNKMSNRVDIK